MSTQGEQASKGGFRRSIWLAVGGTAVLGFLAGVVFDSRRLHAAPAEAAAGQRVFELMIYHTHPGQAEPLEAVFRDVSKLQAKYGLDVLGSWVPNDDPAWRDTYIYLVAHPSRAAADANWKALHDDPAFPPYRAAAAPLIEQVNGDYRVDEIYLRPSDFSALK